MRIDHHACQRATWVASFGFLIQVVLGLTLLIFGLVSPAEGISDGNGDTAFYFGSFYVLGGVLAWLTLIVVFHQHKMERLEALEEDEIASERGDTSMFEGDEARVAARRLRLMHKWLVPIVSLVLAGLILAGLGLLLVRAMGRVRSGEAVFKMTELRGWGVAICLAGTLISFIFSRFVAGMAKQPVWQNLRGGAGFMVGNALVMLAIAVGIAFRFFENDTIIWWVCELIPYFMLLLAAEIVLNFILNLYRPRVPGEVPRPAFDSRVLSFFSSPDSIVRSVNEAINYQFGFDVTSSWGYRLLLRSFIWLIVFGTIVMLSVSMMVVVKPNQQAVRLRGGEIIGEIHRSGIMWKWPWPLEHAQVVDVSTIRTLPLTAQRLNRRLTPEDRAQLVHLWSENLNRQTDEELQPFMVASLQVEEDPRSMPAASVGGEEPGAAGESVDENEKVDPDTVLAQSRVSSMVSLVEAEIQLEYRIKPDPEEGLAKYLHFASDGRSRDRRLTLREVALRAVALRELTQLFSRLTIDDVLAARRSKLSRDVADAVQQAFDRAETGVEVQAINITMLRPSGEQVVTAFVDVAMKMQERIRLMEMATQGVETRLFSQVGSTDAAERIYNEIIEWERMQNELGTDHEDAVAKRLEIKRMLLETDGEIASVIYEAEKERWVRQIRELTRAREHEGKLLAYQAAPQLYKQREIMRVLGMTMGDKSKYLLGIDPSRVDIDVEFKRIDSVLNLTDSLNEGESQ